MKYNTQRDKLIMPEYGRSVQNMVDYALTLPTREQRQACAEKIISIMATLQSEQAGETDFMHKLWNHLARIAHYQLDIDYPVEIIPEEEVMQHPEPMHYPMKRITLRHYGHIIESFLDHARQMPPGEERDAYVAVIANQMKQSLFVWNPDSMDEQLIATDIRRYTDGELTLDLDKHTFAPVSMPTKEQLGLTSKKKRK